MRSNVPSAHGDLVLRDVSEQLAIYDSLPSRWRALVDSLPSKQDMTSVKWFLDNLGEQVGYDEIVRQFKRKYPDWREDFR